MERVAAIDGLNMIYDVASHVYDRHLLGKESLAVLVGDELSRILGRLAKDTGLRPVLVLDGFAPTAKKPVLDMRLQARAVAHQEATAHMAKAEQAKKAAEEAAAVGDAAAQAKALAEVHQNHTEALKAARRNVRFEKADRWAVLHRLSREGFVVFRAPGEGEAQAAYWQREGVAGLVITRDFDAFLYGATKVAKDARKPNEVTLASDILKKNGAQSLQHLVEATVLSGRSDYAPALPGIESFLHAMWLVEVVGFDKLIEQANVDGTPWREARAVYETPNVCRCDIYAEACTCQGGFALEVRKSQG